MEDDLIDIAEEVRVTGSTQITNRVIQNLEIENVQK